MIAMAIIARWRMPPENSWGSSSTRWSGCGMPTRPSISIGPGPRLPACSAPSWIRAISAICRPTVCTGLSAVSGSWKIIAISPPRTERIRCSLGREQVLALPEHAVGLDRRRRLGIRPMMLIAVTDLPDPDSPTMANTSPRRTSKLTPSTALTMPASVVKLVRRFCTDSRTSRSLAGAAAAGSPGSRPVTSVIIASASGRGRRAGRRRRARTPAR